MTPEEIVARHPSRHRIDPVLGLMRQCTKCEEWWSATKEFFSTAPRNGALGLHSWCWACTKEALRERRKTKVIA